MAGPIVDETTTLGQAKAAKRLGLTFSKEFNLDAHRAERRQRQREGLNGIAKHHQRLYNPTPRLRKVGHNGGQ
jgi:hypothetical protein